MQWHDAKIPLMRLQGVLATLRFPSALPSLPAPHWALLGALLLKALSLHRLPQLQAALDGRDGMHRLARRWGDTLRSYLKCTFDHLYETPSLPARLTINHWRRGELVAAKKDFPEGGSTAFALRSHVKGSHRTGKRWDHVPTSGLKPISQMAPYPA